MGYFTRLAALLCEPGLPASAWRPALATGLALAAAGIGGLVVVLLAAALWWPLGLLVAAGAGAAAAWRPPAQSLGLLLALVAYPMITAAALLEVLPTGQVFNFPPMIAPAYLGGLVVAAIARGPGAWRERYFALPRPWRIIGAVLVAGIAGYAAVGLLRTELVAVGYYARMMVFPLALLVFVAVARQTAPRSHDARYLAAVLVGVLAPVVAIYLAEGLLAETWYRLFNVVEFETVKSGGEVVMADIMRAVRRDFLNLSGDIPYTEYLVSVRLFGPDLHYVSSAYLLLALLMPLLLLRAWVAAFGVLALLALTGIKGPLIITTIVLLAAAAIQWRPGAFAPTVAGTIAVLGTGMIGFGLMRCDPHVIGLMGGVMGWLDAPWGQGFGIGGNHSVEWSMADYEWPWPPGTGCHWYRHPFESAFGALLYQTGPLALLALVAVLHTLRRLRPGRAAAGLLAERHAGAIVVATGFGLVLTGLLQEEALSPSALTVPVILLTLAATEPPNGCPR